MTSDDITTKLRRYLDDNTRGLYSRGEAYVRALELAALMEPRDLLAVLPERMHSELAGIGARPLPPREEFGFGEAGMVLPENMEACRRVHAEREDRMYHGLCRMHEYFAKQKKGSI